MFTASGKRVVVRVVLQFYLLLLSSYVKFLVLKKNLTILSEIKGYMNFYILLFIVQ